MNSDFVGKCVSLDCGSLGFYQGKIVSINLEDESLSLKQVFKDGKAYTLPVVTFW